MRTNPKSDRLHEGMTCHSVRAISIPLCDLGLVKVLRAYRLASLLASLLVGGSFSLSAQTNDTSTNGLTNIVAASASVTKANTEAGAVAEPPRAPEPERKPAPTSGKLDYSSFKIVSDRNIFNGNRSGQRMTTTRSSTKQISVRVESFSLVGTLLSEDKAPVAFFDGTSSEFRKTLKAGGIIAGFTVKEILHAGVRLAEGTNMLDIFVGTGMRREDEGLWKSSTTVATYASSSSSVSSGSSGGGTSNESRSGNNGRSFSRNGNGNSRNGSSSGRGNGGGSSAESNPSSDSPPTAEVNDVLKKLMEKREKE